MTRTYQMHLLETIFPPFSNSSVKLLTSKINAGLAGHLKKSKMYMIGGRPDATLLITPADDSRILVDVVVGGNIVDSGCLHANKVPGFESDEGFLIEWDDRSIWIGRQKTKFVYEYLFWLTPDSIYWHKARNCIFLSGFDAWKNTCTYELLYVGIANGQDSYTRLLKKGHAARQEILSDEMQRHVGARVSDEIILFLFDVDFLNIKQYSADDDFGDMNTYPDKSRIISDAEKAFIKIMDPGYNNQKYLAYPKGVDGLYDLGLNGYSYSINENFIFTTPVIEIAGSRSEGGISNSQDIISISGNKVVCKKFST
ncbi:hypothetical protein [Acidovorax delafieldii]|uniref:hypothetical protein n=1 Tax=Acidovorax delafieldii TaxID=47920 RepID=UPI003ECEE36C